VDQFNHHVTSVLTGLLTGCIYCLLPENKGPMASFSWKLFFSSCLCYCGDPPSYHL